LIGEAAGADDEAALALLLRAEQLMEPREIINRFFDKEAFGKSLPMMGFDPLTADELDCCSDETLSIILDRYVEVVVLRMKKVDVYVGTGTFVTEVKTLD